MKITIDLKKCSLSNANRLCNLIAKHQVTLLGRHMILNIQVRRSQDFSNVSSRR
jgi:hypothetical protein